MPHSLHHAARIDMSWAEDEKSGQKQQWRHHIFVVLTIICTQHYSNGWQLTTSHAQLTSINQSINL